MQAFTNLPYVSYEKKGRPMSGLNKPDMLTRQKKPARLAYSLFLIRTQAQSKEGR